MGGDGCGGRNDEWPPRVPLGDPHAPAGNNTTRGQLQHFPMRGHSCHVYMRGLALRDVGPARATWRQHDSPAAADTRGTRGSAVCRGDGRSPRTRAARPRRRRGRRSERCRSRPPPPPPSASAAAAPPHPKDVGRYGTGMPPSALLPPPLCAGSSRNWRRQRRRWWRRHGGGGRVARRWSPGVCTVWRSATVMATTVVRGRRR